MNQTPIAQFVSDGQGGTAPFGVDLPLRAVTLFGGENGKIGILLGNSVPSHPDLIYVQLPERNCVVEVRKEFATLFDITPNDLRDRKITRLNSDYIDRVTIDKPGQPSLVLGRRENRWRMLNPTQSLANPSNITGLIQILNEGDIANFVSDTAIDLSKYGLDRPKMRITFSSYSSENTAEENAGETVLATLAFGNSEGGLTYARLEQEPYIFSVPEKFVTDLPTNEINFRTLDIFKLRRDQLESVHIEKPGNEWIDLVRGNNGKWVVKGEQAHQDESKVQSFLNTLTGLRATAWVGNSAPEQTLNASSLVVRFRYQLGESNRETELRFDGSNSENQHYGTSTEQTGTFLVDDEQFERLNASLIR
jgi:hypothetical protein